MKEKKWTVKIYQIFIERIIIYKFIFNLNNRVLIMNTHPSLGYVYGLKYIF